jgi:uncharacterized membrane protein YbhN (UPF0104 family)
VPRAMIQGPHRADHVPAVTHSAAVSKARRRSWLRMAATYALGIAIVIWVARGISVDQLTRDLLQARMSLFVLVCLASVVIWVLGDTWLYARLFSYFKIPTGLRELLPALIAHEFFQAVNGVAAGTAVVTMVYRRKHVDFITAGAILMFQGVIDLQVIGLMALAASLVAPKSIPELSLGAAVLFIGASSVFALLWLFGSRLSLARWSYVGPLFAVLRRARATDCLKLAAIRTLIFAAQGAVLYLELLSFQIKVPLELVMAGLPVILIAGALPIVPSGLGPRQAAIVAIFSDFGSRASLLTMALAHTGLVMLVRVALGLFSTDLIAREVFASKPQPTPITKELPQC